MPWFCQNVLSLSPLCFFWSALLSGSPVRLNQLSTPWPWWSHWPLCVWEDFRCGAENKLFLFYLWTHLHSVWCWQSVAADVIIPNLESLKMSWEPCSCRTLSAGRPAVCSLPCVASAVCSFLGKVRVTDTVPQTVSVTHYTLCGAPSCMHTSSSHYSALLHIKEAIRVIISQLHVVVLCCMYTTSKRLLAHTERTSI